MKTVSKSVTISAVSAFRLSHTQLQGAANSSMFISMQREHSSSWLINPMISPISCLWAFSDPRLLLSPLLFSCFRTSVALFLPGAGHRNGPCSRLLMHASAGCLRDSRIPCALLYFNNEDGGLPWINWQMEFESQFLLLINIEDSHIIQSSTMHSCHILWHRQLAVPCKKEFNLHSKLSALQNFEV